MCWQSDPKVTRLIAPYSHTEPEAGLLQCIRPRLDRSRWRPTWQRRVASVVHAYVVSQRSIRRPMLIMFMLRPPGRALAVRKVPCREIAAHTSHVACAAICSVSASSHPNPFSFSLLPATPQRKHQMQRRPTLKIVLCCRLIVRPAHTVVSDLPAYIHPTYTPFTACSSSCRLRGYERTSVSHHKSTAAVPAECPPSPPHAPLSSRPCSRVRCPARFPCL